MTDTEFRDVLKKGKAEGGYIFYGDEDFLKNRYAADMAKSVCDDEFEEFNSIKFDAADIDPGVLEEAIAVYPMMSDRKAVLLTGFRVGSMKDKELEAYLRIFSQMPDFPHTVLGVVVPSGELDPGTQKKPSSVFKKLTAELTPVQFDLKGQAALKKWINAQLAEAGAEVDFDAPEALILRCGRNMHILHGECKKLAAYAMFHNTPVTPAMVDNICCKSEEEDAFALANAVLAGDRRGALAALKGYRDRKEEPVAVTASLGRVLTDMLHVCVLQNQGMQKKEIAAELKMHEYKTSLYMQSLRGMEPARLQAAMQRCFDTDRLLKSTDLKYIAVERLICTIPAKKR